MGRHITFNKKRVLESALLLFWSSGFAGSPLRQIEHATKLHPGSLYHHFGNKEGLYLQVLHHYIDAYLMPRLEKHLQSGNPLEGIRRFLTTGYRHTGESAFKNCCFIVCASTELHLIPTEARDTLKSTLAIIHQTVARQLQKGIKKSLLDASINTDKTATEILNVYLSLQVRASIEANQHQLDQLVKQHLQRVLERSGQDQNESRQNAF